MRYTAITAAAILTISGRPIETPAHVAQTTGKLSPIVQSEFLYETAPFPSAHASTIVEGRAGLVAAWFGGTREGAPDVGIWLSRHVKGAWTAPVEVATGVQPDGTRHPCWNPVLFELPDRSIVLFYKVGPDPRNWWGMERTSADGGHTWSDARRLPEGILGPIKNKPIRLGDGTIISPSSTESNDTPSVWRIHFERSEDAGRTWTIVRPTPVPGAPELERDPAEHPRVSRWRVAGRRPDAIRARVSDPVHGRRQDVDAADAYVPPQPKCGN